MICMLGLAYHAPNDNGRALCGAPVVSDRIKRDWRAINCLRCWKTLRKITHRCKKP